MSKGYPKFLSTLPQFLEANGILPQIRLAKWLTNRQVAGSIPNGVTGIFQ
jgi:hypothetical protein